MDQHLSTKLYIPPIRPALVSRPRLIERLNEGLHRKLTLISAPAGFGKTTLVTEWLDNLRLGVKEENRTENKIAWLSLDESDNDSARFLGYVINAFQTFDSDIAKGALHALQSPQQPPPETTLTSLINEIATIQDRMILVLDDYHFIETQSIHDALTFLLENQPPKMHLVIVTREDPHLPLARLRAKDKLTEMRAIDLRFTFAEAIEFLNHVMGLNLSTENIATLETRTEGWITGLQLAAISMQGYEDATNFIQSFTGSHRFVLDYLIEEVLELQSESIQNFLLKTAILDRLTGTLCNALTDQEDGQQTLEYLEQANLFIVPLDNERRWYRYHHLFADLLRQRLHQSTTSSPEDERRGMAELHRRASVWYEDNDMAIKAFRHAAAANDIERATRLIEGGGMPLTFRGALEPVLNWLESLPTSELDARPLLWVTYASAVLGSGQINGVEEKLQASEAALQGIELDDKKRDLIGRIAATRATLAWGQDQAETIIAQSRRALEYLHPDNLPFRTSTTWKLAYAHQLQGDRAAAIKAYTETIAICEASGNFFINILASSGLGDVQIAENQLYLAAETYQRGLQLVGDQPLAVACGPHHGLARVLYEWNDLDASQHHGQKAFQLAQNIDSTDAFALCGLFLTRLKLTQGDAVEAASILAEVDQFVRLHNFMLRMPDVTTTQVLLLLQQGNLTGAADLATKYELPISQARIHLARGEPSAALATLEPFRQHVEAKGWQNERLKVMVLQAVALHLHGEKEEAVHLLSEALALAEPGGFIRTFVDEGRLMAQLLYEAAARGIMPVYTGKLLDAFEAEEQKCEDKSYPPSPQHLIEPLSEREIEVLELIAAGHTNKEIASRLYLSLNTVKVHTRNIYGKLSTNNRTQAAAKGRDLGILPTN